MELDHFISGSRVDASFVKDKWLDSSSLSTRSFTESKKHNIAGISLDDDFSLFCTLEKKNNGSGNFLTNKEHDSRDGFALCFDSNNSFFVQTFGLSPFAYSFKDISLGQKNCFSVVKQNNALSIYKYNLHGTGISQEETFLFPVSCNHNGGNYFFGSGNSIKNAIGIPGFSGLFDQMVLFDTALTRDQCLSVFSGFQPWSGTYSSSYSLVYENSGFQKTKNTYILDADIQDLTPFLNDVVIDLPITTNYVQYISGYADFELESWAYSGYRGLSDNFCKITGTTVPVTRIGTWLSSTDRSFYFTGTIHSSYNISGERTVSQFYSFYTDDSSTEDFFTYNTYQKFATGSEFSIIYDSSYLTGFYMDGVVTNTYNPSGLTLLANISGENYDNLNKLGVYDKVAGLFSTSGLSSGNRVYWGISGLITGYNLSGNYIDILNISETDSFPLIYDLYSGNLSFLQSTLWDYATGRFVPDTSIVFTGLNSWTELQRLPKRSFWETSSYHLSHGGKKIIPNFETGIYLDTEDYWV